MITNSLPKGNNSFNKKSSLKTESSQNSYRVKKPSTPYEVLLEKRKSKDNIYSKSKNFMSKNKN